MHKQNTWGIILSQPTNEYSTWVPRSGLRGINALRFFANQKWKGVNYTKSNSPITPFATMCVCAVETCPRLCLSERFSVCRKMEDFLGENTFAVNASYFSIISHKNFHEVPTWCCNPITVFTFSHFFLSKVKNVVFLVTQKNAPSGGSICWYFCFTKLLKSVCHDRRLHFPCSSVGICWK